MAILYLDHAASSQPKPAWVRQAVAEHLGSVQTNPMRSATETNELESLREKLRQFFALNAEQSLVFCANSTMAANLFILSLAEEQPSLQIYCDSYSHNCVLRPAHRVSAGKEKILNHGELDQIGSGPFLLCLTLASNVTGEIFTKLPWGELEKLCVTQNGWLLLDAAQFAGNAELPEMSSQLKKRTAIFTSGHKYLLGPESSGLLILPADFKGPAVISGGTGSDSQNPLMPAELPYRFEAGTYNLTALAGLAAAIDHVSYEDFLQKRRALNTGLQQYLEALDNFTIVTAEQKHNTGITLLTHRNLPPSELAYILYENYKIITRAGLFCAPHAMQKLPGDFAAGGVRISFGYDHDENDLDQLCSALKELDAF